MSITPIIERIDRSPDLPLCESSSSSSNPKVRLHPNQDKKAKDKMLERIASPALNTTTIWLNDVDLQTAKKITKKIDDIYQRQEMVAIISGLLAAVGSGLGCIPMFGGAVGAPFSAAANYYGTSAGIDVGFDFADQCDLRQDLYKDTLNLYTSLATRLLDRYIKASQADMARQLETSYTSKFTLLSPEKKTRLERKKQILETLSKNIGAQIAKLEKGAIEILWGIPLSSGSKDEKVETPSVPPKAQKQLIKFEKEIKAITKPLKEVCEYIQEPSLGFSISSLHNERDTMTVRYYNILRVKLEKEHANEMKDLQDRVTVLEQANIKLEQVNIKLEQVNIKLEQANKKHQKRASKHKAQNKALLQRVEALEKKLPSN